MKHGKGDGNFDRLQRAVIGRGLCTRCGVCVGACPAGVLRLSPGLYPVLAGHCTACGVCVAACAGADFDFPAAQKRIFGAPYDPLDWRGCQRRTLVGHAADQAVRERGASGGLTTALLLHLLRSGRVRGAAVVGMDPGRPYRARSLLARSEAELLAAAKSKYAIVPSMDVLSAMRREEGPFAVVALPCQVHGLRKLEEADPRLSARIACILGLYCRGNMEPQAYDDVLTAAGVPLEDVAAMEYRGGGWPGRLTVTLRGGEKRSFENVTTRSLIWQVMLRLYGAGRCFLCSDALAEMADLSLGDFWATDYHGALGEMTRATQVTERTPKGREILESAREAGLAAFQELPPERFSRRTRSFAMEKKLGAYRRIRRLDAGRRPVPDYGFAVPAGPSGHPLGDAALRLLRRVGGDRRKALLRFFHSPVGRVIDGANRLRKRASLGRGRN